MPLETGDVLFTVVAADSSTAMRRVIRPAQGCDPLEGAGHLQRDRRRQADGESVQP